MCKLSVVTVVLLGWHCFSSSYVVARDWSTSACYVCDTDQLWLYSYSGHCVLVCAVDKRPLLLCFFLLLLLSCGKRANRESCFLQDRVKGKLLIGRSTGLCNNLLIQRLSWATSGSVEQVTGLLHWGESISHRLLALLLSTTCFIRKRAPLISVVLLSSACLE